MAKILLIDDEKLVRDSIKALLAQAGHEVRAAADGPEGLNLYRRDRPDLVILDRDLPGMTGSAVLSALMAIDPTANVVVFTGFPDPAGEDKYMDLGARAFFSKDIPMATLGRIVERATHGAAGNGKSGGAVLVVDDDPGVRAVLKRFLANKGYAVAVAEGGREALTAIAKAPPKLVLLDINMPDMRGLDVLKELGRTKPEVAVIMITGQEDMEIARECMRLGASDYIVKPINFEYLETSVWAKLLTVP